MSETLRSRIRSTKEQFMCALSSGESCKSDNLKQQHGHTPGEQATMHSDAGSGTNNQEKSNENAQNTKRLLKVIAKLNGERRGVTRQQSSTEAERQISCLSYFQNNYGRTQVSGPLHDNANVKEVVAFLKAIDSDVRFMRGIIQTHLGRLDDQRKNDVLGECEELIKCALQGDGCEKQCAKVLYSMMMEAPRILNVHQIILMSDRMPPRRHRGFGTQMLHLTVVAKLFKFMLEVYRNYQPHKRPDALKMYLLELTERMQESDITREQLKEILKQYEVKNFNKYGSDWTQLMRELNESDNK